MELVSLPHFLHDFRRKICLTLYFINWPNFIAWLSSLLEILGNMCIVNFCKVCDVINLEINLSLLIKPFFYITKCQDKNVYIWRIRWLLKPDSHLSKKCLLLWKPFKSSFHSQDIWVFFLTFLVILKKLLD